MTIEVAGWWILALAAIGCALGMLSARNPVHAALWLVGNFVCLAVIFLMLSAPMLFAIQLIVYAGAIMVLFLFVVMFFMSAESRKWVKPAIRSQLWFAWALISMFFMILLWAWSSGGIALQAGTVVEDGQPVTAFVEAQDKQSLTGNPLAIAAWMFNVHSLPFELVGILLLVALLGVVVVARDPRAEGRTHIAESAPKVHQIATNGEPVAGAEVEQ